MLKRTKNIFLVGLTAFGALLAAAGLNFIAKEQGVYAADGDMSHAVCGKTDCGHEGHGAITYLPWTDERSLPSYGNYYLTRDYENVPMTVREHIKPEGVEDGTQDTEVTGDEQLNLDLNGFTISGTNTSPTIEVITCLNVCDSSAAQTGRIVNASTVAGSSAVRVSDFGELNFYGGTVAGQSSGIYNNGRGTVSLYGGDISGDTYGLYSVGGTVNISVADGLALTVAGEKGVSATGGKVNMFSGVVEGASYGLETGGTAAATVTGGTVTGGEYDLYCASQGVVRLENTPLFSAAPKFFVANNASQPSGTYLNVLRYTFTDGAGAGVEAALYTDISQIAAGKYLVNCTEAQAAKITCGNEELELDYEANGLKIAPILAKIGDNKYRTLAEAFTAAALPANDGCTVKLITDSTLVDAVQVSSRFTVDLNGHGVTSALDPIFSAQSGSDITITDSAGGGSLINSAGSAVVVDGGKVTLLATSSLSGVTVNTSSATVAGAGLSLMNLPFEEGDKLKLALGAACNAEEYFAVSDGDYADNLEFTHAGGQSSPYVLAYIAGDGAIKLHVHSFEDEFTVDTPATCTEAGSKSKHCSGC